MSTPLTINDLISAYASGYFPMAEGRDTKELYWYSPEERGIILLDKFNIPRSLMKFMRHCHYEIKFDTAFEQVIRACADTKSEKRDNTWINDEIIYLYCELAQAGYAHSVECWTGDKLSGGLYGVSLGGAFFGESMFSHAPNASKVALVHLVSKLRDLGYTLLDTQYTNDHLMQFGVTSVKKTEYLEMLENALKNSPRVFQK